MLLMLLVLVYALVPGVVLVSEEVSLPLLVSRLCVRLPLAAIPGPLNSANLPT